MNAADFQALLPLIMLSVGATALMLQIAFWRELQLTTWLSIAVLILAALSVVHAAAVAPRMVTPLLFIDPTALLMSALFCLAAAITVILSADYLQQRGDQPEEYFLLLVLSTLGACVLVSAQHMASLLLGLELLSVSLYALIAYPDRSVLPLEAAIKYLVLSGAASATALFGLALLYAATGELQFGQLGAALAAYQGDTGTVFVGAGLLLAGMAFKLSLAPFHLWTPDVYDGAPAPVTGFLASVAKAAVFVVLLRLFLQADLFRYPVLAQLMALMAIFSMLAGNFLALLQSNIKRMLAYSSIAHIGYLCVVFMAATQAQNRALASEAALYYLVAYTATTLAAFGLLTQLSATTDQRDKVQLREVSGLLWHRPLPAALLMIALLSLAGIPLTAGFIGKFYLVSAAVAGTNWLLLAALVIGSGVGIYYYLRVVFYMCRRVEDHNIQPNIPTGWHGGLVAWILIGGILLLGTLPQPLMAYLRSIL